MLLFLSYVLAKSHGQAEQGSYLVAHSCAARFVYLSASHFCSVKNGTLQFWNGILLYIGLYAAKFVFSLRLVPLPLVTNWRRKSVRRWFQNSAEFYPCNWFSKTLLNRSTWKSVAIYRIHWAFIWVYKILQLCTGKQAATPHPKWVNAPDSTCTSTKAGGA